MMKMNPQDVTFGPRVLSPSNQPTYPHPLGIIDEHFNEEIYPISASFYQVNE